MQINNLSRNGLLTARPKISRTKGPAIQSNEERISISHMDEAVILAGIGDGTRDWLDSQLFWPARLAVLISTTPKLPPIVVPSTLPHLDHLKQKMQDWNVDAV